MNQLIQLKKAAPVCLVVLVLTCFGLPSSVRAVSPPPDGGYPGNNTAEGDGALLLLTTGGKNTADGFRALFANTTGSDNTASGAAALFRNTTGGDNTANGFSALSQNTTGGNNTATGSGALEFNTAGSNNTANGFKALFSNSTGVFNTASGAFALFSNTTGTNNTANGFGALFNNTTGINNTAVGFSALASNTTGHDNIALGANAGANLTTEILNIDIGNPGVAGDSDTIRIGTPNIGAQATYISGIRGQTTAFNDAIPVLIDSNHQLGTMNSSRRFKTDIKRIDKASECVLGLNPVTFRYKVHKNITPQFGLIAEEVAKVNPDLVIYDADGKPYTVRYDAVNAMLLNEFLKEHRRVQELEATVAQQRKHSEATAECQQKQIDALTAGLQKVSAQLELSKPAPQTARNAD